MYSPRLFCPASRHGTHSDGFRITSQSSSRKRKRGGIELNKVSGANHEAESLRPAFRKSNPATTLSAQEAQETQLQTQGPPKLQESFGNYSLVKKAETAEDNYSSESESGTSEATSSSSKSPSSSWSRPSPRRRPVSGPPRSDGLRQQHLAAVSAILHRCLLQGDFFRASRAWALLLRSEMNGHPMDVRNQGRWGIGAEILLQKSLSQRRDHLREDRGSSPEENNEMSTKNTKLKYSEHLRIAQDYYDRLIVQYPHRKRPKDAIGPLEFYPALFGLRIFSEQQIHEDLLRSFQEKDPHDEDKIRNETSPENSSASPKNRNSEFLRITKLLESSVTRGKEMANQLDELLTSPPYSDDFRLQNLRNMIGLWIEDLLASPYFKKASVVDNRRDN